MENLNAKTGVEIPKGLSGLDKLPQLHKDVIEVEDMLDYDVIGTQIVE